MFPFTVEPFGVAIAAVVLIIYLTLRILYR
jgi:hypothetical protein